MNNTITDLNYHLGLTCSDFDGKPMQAYNPKFRYLIDPKNCFPKLCGNLGNECYLHALQPSTCSITKGNMCYQDNEGKYECCLPQGGKAQKLCTGKRKAPCRLVTPGKLDSNHILYMQIFMSYYRIQSNQILT